MALLLWHNDPSSAGEIQTDFVSSSSLGKGTDDDDSFASSVDVVVAPAEGASLCVSPTAHSQSQQSQPASQPEERSRNSRKINTQKCVFCGGGRALAKTEKRMLKVVPT